MTGSEKRMFAWGTNTWGESSCPSVAAFPLESGQIPRLYGDPALYDDLVRAFIAGQTDEDNQRAYNDGEGEIPEDIAREKWLAALAELEREPLKYPAIISEHRQVAEKLGWIETRSHTNTRKP